MIRTPIVERSVDLGDVWLNVASAGSGRPVVLLHGVPDSWRLWRHQIRLLAAAGIDPAATMNMITTATGRVGARVLIGAGWSRFGHTNPTRTGCGSRPGC